MAYVVVFIISLLFRLHHYTDSLSSGVVFCLGQPILIGSYDLFSPPGTAMDRSHAMERKKGVGSRETGK